MSGIKRFNCEAVDNSAVMEMFDPEGEYVLHSDHEAEVARLRDELDGIKEQYEGYREAASEHLAELRAEVEAYRKDAERYRWLRDQSPWSDSKNPCPYSEQEDGQLRCITAGLDDKIDAAMGASA